jgi:hypothetical protein
MVSLGAPLAASAILRPRVVRSQAIPIGVYRRRIVLDQVRPYPLILAAMFVVYRLAVYLWGASSPLETMLLDARLAQSVGHECAGDGADCVGRPGLTALDDIPMPPPPAPAGIGAASLSGIGGAPLTNIKIAVGFLDGAVIQPGEKLSFDDVARTWDFQEDPRYLMSTATSARGIIYMRGGGVCWLATALWNAALEAGLDTTYRQNHYGLVPILRAGLDATNTVVIKNDSAVPITVHAWMDNSAVRVELLPTRPLDRTATVRGPFARGGGTYVSYQDITWDDGTETTNEFRSHYYW